MLIKQLSVFIENKPGRLVAALDVLGQSNVDISALSLADTSDYGILRLIVNNPEVARDALKKTGVIVKVNEVLALSMEDVPGGLSQILKTLSQNQINIDYMYAFAGKSTNKALTVIKVENPVSAEEALISAGINTAVSKDIYRI